MPACQSPTNQKGLLSAIHFILPCFTLLSVITISLIRCECSLCAIRYPLFGHIIRVLLRLRLLPRFIHMYLGEPTSFGSMIRNCCPASALLVVHMICSALIFFLDVLWYGVDMYFALVPSGGRSFVRLSSSNLVVSFGDPKRVEEDRRAHYSYSILFDSTSFCLARLKQKQRCIYDQKKRALRLCRINLPSCRNC